MSLTEQELKDQGIAEALARHTPTVAEVSVFYGRPLNTCTDVLDGLYGECDGEMRVVCVRPAYENYSWVELECDKCHYVRSYENPLARTPAPEQPAQQIPRWRQGKMAAAGERQEEMPF